MRDSLHNAADTIGHTIQGAAQVGAGTKLFSALLATALAYIAPFQSFLIAALVLVILDQVTGTWAAMKRGERFEAKKMKMLVGKIVLYPLAILIAHLMVETFFKDVPVVESLTYMVAMFICAVEFQSNIENIGSITDIDIWSQVKDWITSRLKTKQDDKPTP